ncbi:MAG: PD-(D/E)XK nuclease family protein [Limisphaerales bacterium]
MNLTPDHRRVRVHFLLGPAGSGKTWRCLGEIRAELKRAPGEAAPLLLLAPKQATFQLERQLLDDPELAGYARLQIVSFDRLAHWLLDTFGAVPELLDDEGRVMVLRALLAREQDALKVFRATARLPGFARQLSQLLREFQRHQVTPERLARLAGRCPGSGPLRDKLHDLHHLLRAYHEWLAGSSVRDGDQLLDIATLLLRDPSFVMRNASPPIAGLWLDGFAEMTPQELDLLCAVLPFCRTSTLAFCHDPQAGDSQSWLSLWSVVRRTYLECRTRVKALRGCEVSEESLARDPAHSRFRDSPALAQLEANWTAPANTAGRDSAHPASSIQHPASPLRLALCANPEAEATLAAREILRHVRAGGRFRDCAVILRTLDHHHVALRRVFTRYGIPFFLDRREPVTHHPLAELTRFALRTLAYGWQPDDWFGALKTGLVHERDEDIDWLENLALAHGWHGAQWFEPFAIPEPRFNLTRAEQLRARLTAPFRNLAQQLGAPVTPGAHLATALRDLWDTLAVESRLQTWDDALARESGAPIIAPPLHTTVLRQMHAWLDNLERAFPAETPPLPLREWLPIVEAGLSTLSVGVIPPALDQVLIGTVDRSRNPELQLALLLGLNEGIFPAPPVPPVLLSDTERDLLAAHDLRLGLDPRAQIAHERYFAYIACTRSRKRLVLSCSAADADGSPLHPSPILTHVQQLSSGLELEKIPTTHDWREAEHTEELLEPILRKLAVSPAGRDSVEPQLEHSEASAASISAECTDQNARSARANSVGEWGSTESHPTGVVSLASLPALAPVVARWHQISASRAVSSLSPAAVAQLYGTELATSVSKLEQFAECPFKFFIAAGLGAEEREEFEIDHRERGSFIHRLLDEFHLRVAASGRRWRDLTPNEAATLAARVGEDLLASPEFALFAADEARRFAARSLIASAQRLLAALVGWMPGCRFDPVAVELGFGMPGSPLPAWRLELADGRAVSLRGRIDRVDLCRDEKTGETFVAVVDYKSSPKRLEPLKVEHGLQLQLLAYLNVLRAFPDALKSALPQPAFGSGDTLQPAGVFYVPLHGASGSSGGRAEILLADEASRRTAYQHAGRFDFARLAHFDSRPAGLPGGQFRYRLNKDGGLIARGSDALPSAEFSALLAQVETNLRRLGEAVFAGEVAVAPVRFSASDKACDRCDYRAICRFDPWAQPYRSLPKPAAGEEES